MPTGEQIVAKAYELQHVIRRDWPGYDAPVPQVWCVPPCDVLGICGQQGAQHCAGSGVRIWYECGIVPGRDVPDVASMVYTPTACTASDAMGTSVDTPEVGCGAVLDWERSGQPSGADHFELVIGTDNWPQSVTTMGFNTSDDGEGNIFERDPGLIVRFIRPKNLGTAAAPSEPARPRPPWGALVYLLAA